MNSQNPSCPLNFVVVSIVAGPKFQREIFPGFSGWINQNMQQSPKAEFKKSDNMKSKSESEMNYNDVTEEEMEEGKLWREAEKKHPWYDAPPKVKVTKKRGLCHMHIELTFGLPPRSVFELFTNPNNLPFFSDKSWRQLLVNKTRKILKRDGPRQIAEAEKVVAWDFLWWSGGMPINLIVDENVKDYTGKYKKQKMKFMKVFEGSYKVEPVYVDSERLCKQKQPKSPEEYKKCSGGQGKIASKVTMDQYFKPYPLFNLPPFSWYIRRTIIQTTTTLLKMLQDMGAQMRVDPDESA